jgi:hypothetical protein
VVDVFSLALGTAFGCTLSLDVILEQRPGFNAGLSILTPDGQSSGGMNVATFVVPSVVGAHDRWMNLWLGGFAPAGTRRVSLPGAPGGVLFQPPAPWSAIPYLVSAEHVHRGSLRFEAETVMVELPFDLSRDTV